MSTSVEYGQDATLAIGTSNRGWKPQQSDGLKPCERCKTQHLKCIYLVNASKCQRCERTGRECVKRIKKLRFRDVSVSGFRKGRNNRKVANNSATTSSRVNVTSELGNSIAEDDNDHDERHDSPAQDILASTSKTVVRHHNEQSPADLTGGLEIQSDLQDRLPTKQHQVHPEFAHQTDEALGSVQDTGSYLAMSSVSRQPNNSQREQNGGYQTGNDANQYQSYLSESSPHGSGSGTIPGTYLDEMVKTAYPKVAEDSQNYLETILLRYFREELAPWFDICDPSHHFADILPQRAREAGPLRDALLTISARNLSQNQVFRSHTGVVTWQGHLLPNLTEELAISYHNECIRELLQLSLNQKKLYDESLLAAVVILRTDEEMLHEDDDKQLFLKIASLFIDAQLPLHLALPHASPQIFHPVPSGNVLSPAVQTDSELESNGLRQACFWTALRQDLHAAFLKQQSVKFPLSRCEAFRQLGSATDAVWANRMVVFCADVLEFCYGSDSIDAKVHPAYTNRDRWHQLRSYEKSLCASLPSSFAPMYCREPDVAKGEIFPSLFYLETIHVSGTTYIELARMLLGWFNPAIPKLGHGCQKATKAVLASNKKTLFRLCGIALSNSNLCPPSLVNAALGKFDGNQDYLSVTYRRRDWPFW